MSTAQKQASGRGPLRGGERGQAVGLQRGLSRARGKHEADREVLSESSSARQPRGLAC